VYADAQNIYLLRRTSCLDLTSRTAPSSLHTIPPSIECWGVAHFLTLLGGKHFMMQRFETKKFPSHRKERVLPLPVPSCHAYW